MVKRVEPITKTTAGLFLPDTAQEKQNVAEVVAVGPGRRNDAGNYIPISFKQGDKILLPESYLSTEVKLEGEKYLIVKEDDVLGKFD